MMKMTETKPKIVYMFLDVSSLLFKNFLKMTDVEKKNIDVKI